MRCLRPLFVALIAVQSLLASCAPVPDAVVVPKPTPSVAALPGSVREAVDRLIHDLMTDQKIPGVSLGIVSENRIVYVTGYGFAHRPTRPAAADTVFRLASISKTFTAIAALQLVERETLDLDAPVQRYVPTFPAKRWSVSTRQLLGHLGGIRHYRGREVFSTTHYTDILAPLSIFKADPLEHQPGTKYLYSTYGYNLVGAVVEAAVQERFTEYVRRYVFIASGMRDAQVDDPTAVIPKLATGYDPVAGDGVTEAPAFDATNKIPGGGFVATAEDMSQYAVAVMTDRLLRPATKDAMWTRQATKDATTTGYGLGWALGQWAGQLTAAHSGGQPGVTTLLFLVPARGCAVIVLTNRGGVKGMSGLVQGIAGAACR